MAAAADQCNAPGWNTYFFRAYFQGIPKELVEAARIDGASELSIFFRIMLPLARPAVVTVAIIYFV